MKIRQSLLSFKTEFEFGKDKLKYKTKHSDGGHSFEIEYALIPSEASEYFEKSSWIRNMSFFWILCGAIITGYRYFSLNQISLSLWVPVGIICYIFYFLFKKEYSVFHTEKGPLFIIKDSKYDTIAKEIDDRRKGQLYLWHGQIDYENDPQTEMNKFEWLLENNVITQKEFEENMQKIKNFHQEWTIENQNPLSDKILN